MTENRRKSKRRAEFPRGGAARPAAPDDAASRSESARHRPGVRREPADDQATRPQNAARSAGVRREPTADQAMRPQNAARSTGVRREPPVDPAAPPEMTPMIEAPGRSGTRRRGGGFVGSMLAAAARGTGLIALAVAIGIVLLQYSDDESSDRLAGGREPQGRSDMVGAPTSTTTTAPGPRSPSEIAVLVLNGSGRAGQAGMMSDRLRVVGYRTLEPGNASRRPTTEVRCREGLEREAAALAAATGLNAEIGELDPESVPAEGAEADCIVTLGTG